MARIWRTRTLALLCVAAVISWMTFGQKIKAQPAIGLPVSLVRHGPEPRFHMTDEDGLLWMTILSNRKARIRQEEIPLENLGNRLRTLFATRNERLLLVSVEGQILLGEFVEFLDAAEPVRGLELALITSHSVPIKQQPALFLRGQHIYTQYFFDREPVPIQPLNQRERP